MKRKVIALLTTTAAVLVLFGVFKLGEVSGEREASAVTAEELIAAWETNDLSSLNCLNDLSGGITDADTAVIHAAMCSLASDITPKPGSEWFLPAPPGYKVVE